MDIQAPKTVPVETTLDKIVKICLIIRHIVWTIVGLIPLVAIAAIFLIGPSKVLQDVVNTLLSGPSLTAIGKLETQLIGGTGAGTSGTNSTGSSTIGSSVNEATPSQQANLPDLSTTQEQCIENTLGLQEMLTIVQTGQVSSKQQAEVEKCFPNGMPANL